MDHAGTRVLVGGTATTGVEVDGDVWWRSVMATRSRRRALSLGDMRREARREKSGLGRCRKEKARRKWARDAERGRRMGHARERLMG
jgi:hypothetical protein